MPASSEFETQRMVDPSRYESLVSIIIPFYNQPDFVRDAVLSAKQQTFPNIEIIVVDDGSPIPVEPLLKEMSGIQILRTKNNGVAAARNLGFERSSGDYLVFLDSDDRLSPVAIEAHLKALRNNPEADLSFGSVKTSQKYLKFDPAGRPSDDLVVYARALEDDRWRRSSSCLAACFSLYTTVSTGW